MHSSVQLNNPFYPNKVGAGYIVISMSGIVVSEVVLPRLVSGRYLGKREPDCFHITYTSRCAFWWL